MKSIKQQKKSKIKTQKKGSVVESNTSDLENKQKADTAAAAIQTVNNLKIAGPLGSKPITGIGCTYGPNGDPRATNHQGIFRI